MNRVIKNRFFAACLCLCLAIALFTGIFAVMGWGSLLSEVGATILYPFRWVVSEVGRAVGGYGRYFDDIEDVYSELESVREENESLRAQINGAEIIADESAWLYRYLGVKEAHTDYVLCPAAVVSTASASGVAGDYATELTLNKGTSSGISTGMPVITPEGLVGVVVEVGAYHCRVSTVLDHTVSVGAVTTRGLENGLVEGDHTEVHNGRAILRYLPEEADIEVGDLVITSGRGSVYPYGIPIGRVERVSVNAFSRTTEAVIAPISDLADIGHVAILTDFIHYVDGYEGSEIPQNTPGGGS